MSNDARLPAHRIGCSSDIIGHFQRVLDRFPRYSIDGEDRIRFTEFAAYLYRPVGEPKNQLTHLLFPEIIFSIPNADELLQMHDATTFPIVSLLASVDSDDLYIKLQADHLTKSGHLERISAIVEMSEVAILSDIWDSIHPGDRAHLSTEGFGEGLHPTQWAHAIKRYMTDESPDVYHKLNRPLRLLEFPYSIARRGLVGTNGSYHHHPEFLLYAIDRNSFVYEEINVPESSEENFYELGDIHVHSLVASQSPLEKAVADIVGADVVRRNPSVMDIYHQRATLSIYRDIQAMYGEDCKQTMKTLGGIVTVSADGCATGIRFLDFNDVDLEKVTQLNNRAYETTFSTRPDPRIIADQYLYVDSVTKSEIGKPESIPHVGDPDLKK